MSRIELDRCLGCSARLGCGGARAARASGLGQRGLDIGASALRALDQAGLVGEDHGLDAVAQAEL
ncbi:MAG TPA: hypothetical protein VFI12_04145, partial [Thermomicrobiales bacterium]|nr:hypothetical protein [Thermomicrobiales bacterium]